MLRYGSLALSIAGSCIGSRRYAIHTPNSRSLRAQTCPRQSRLGDGPRGREMAVSICLQPFRLIDLRVGSGSDHVNPLRGFERPLHKVPRPKAAIPLTAPELPVSKAPTPALCAGHSQGRDPALSGIHDNPSMKVWLARAADFVGDGKQQASPRFPVASRGDAECYAGRQDTAPA